MNNLNRGNSICPSQETLLLAYIKNNDIGKITQLITSHISLLDSEIEEHTGRNALCTACMEKSIHPQTIECLIKLGANVGGNTEWKPLHLACINPNSAILEVILKHLNPAQINETVDGNTALLALVKNDEIKKKEEEFLENVKLLLNANIRINQSDGKNLTAIFWAAKNNLKLVCKAILENGKTIVDLDTHKLRNKNARNLIQDNNLYPIDLLQKHTPPQIPKDRIFSLIKEGKEGELIEYFDSLANPTDYCNLDDGISTLLQYSCQNCLTEFVKYLLDHSVDVNRVIQNNNVRPIEIVAARGFFEIFQLLIESNEIELSPKILCTLLRHSDKIGNIIDYEKCCKSALKAIDQNFDINGLDENQNTALHYSLRYYSDDTSCRLLNLGASLAARNNFTNMPIEDIKPELLEKHLNDCVQFHGNLNDEDKRNTQIVFEYKTLLSPRKIEKQEECLEKFLSEDNLVPETEVIEYMSRTPEIRHLLKHPVIVSLLFMKWHRIRSLFYFNLFFYVIFVASLYTYLFTYYTDFKQQDSNEILTRVSYIILSLTFWILLFREFFQIIVSPRKYLRNFENLVEILLIIVTGIILYVSSTNDTHRQLASVAILLSAFELVLMVGAHPKLSTNVVMFKTVSHNFFKLLLWYSLLIIAFALSFFILWGDNENQFMGLGQSIFKTIVMLTGEFDASSINFETYPAISKLIFSLFVFMITIVLLNLLNGLAVNDTQAIRSDAELVGLVVRAQHIYYVETMLLGNILPSNLIQFTRKLCCCIPFYEDANYNFLKPVVNKILLFRNVRNTQLTVDSRGKFIEGFQSTTQKNKTKWFSQCACNCIDLSLDRATVRRCLDIIKNRRYLDKKDDRARIEELFLEINDLRDRLNAS